MPLEATLADVTTRLREGRFPNEQAISQGIVLRILQELGWDTWDTSRVWPEFQTGEGRADFALCHPPQKPLVLIEVKQLGKAEDAVRQALEYAFHTGVPFVILTDGRTWSFYLPAEPGSYEDRRVYKLDLYERSAAEAASTLHHYLAPADIQSGRVLETARAEYRNRNRRRHAQTEIPAAWLDLVEKGDELLVEILTNAVESRCGIRPDENDVAEFLEALGSTPAASRASTVSFPPPSPLGKNTASTTRRPASTEISRQRKLKIKDKFYSYPSAKEAMILVLRELALTDPTLLERCSQHPHAQGSKRRYIARTAEELYPDREDLRDMRAELPGGWLVATNLNNVLKKSIIRLAAELAGLKFGRDITIDF